VLSAATRHAKGPADKAGLEQAIALDARFAAAHSELGWCLFGMVTENLLLPGEAGPLMRASAQRAIQEDPLNLISSRRGACCSSARTGAKRRSWR
jgi:hypothetical protein